MRFLHHQALTFYTILCVGFSSVFATKFAECARETRCYAQNCELNEVCALRLCTGVTGEIKCKNNIGVLSINRLFFGRTSLKICPFVSGIVDCNTSPSLSHQQLTNAKRLCDNETSCSIQAVFSFSDACKVKVWGDPCPDKSKYLEVNYTCVNKAGLNYWGEWEDWGACSKSCDTGIQTRRRNCVDPPNKTCTKSTCAAKKLTFETGEQSCNTFKCPESTTSIMSTSETYKISSATYTSSSSSVTYETSSSIHELQPRSSMTSEVMTSSAILKSSTVVSSYTSPHHTHTISSVTSETSSVLRVSSPAYSSSSINSLSPSSSRLTSAMTTLLTPSERSHSTSSFTESSSFSKIASSASLKSSSMEKLSSSSKRIISSSLTLSSSFKESSFSSYLSSSKVSSLSSYPSSSIMSSFSREVPSSKLVTSFSYSMSLSSKMSLSSTTSSSLSSVKISISSKIKTSKHSLMSLSMNVSLSTRLSPSISTSLSSKPNISSKSSKNTIQQSLISTRKSRLSTFTSNLLSNSMVTHTGRILSSSSSSLSISISAHGSSSVIVSSSVVVTSPPSTTPFVIPTDSPEKPKYHVNVTMTLVWRDFCRLSQDFREGLALLLTERIKERQNADQVVLMNLGNCVSKPDKASVVKFYISVQSKSTPDEHLTQVAYEELLKLIKSGETSKLGGHFVNGTLTKVVIIVKDDEEKWPIWLIILIVIAAIIFLLWLCCCCWIFCGRKDKQIVKRKYTFQHIDPLGIPHVKVNDEDIDDTQKFTSTLSVTVRPKSPTHFDNPTYEMDALPTNGPGATLSQSPSTFRPVNLTLVNLKVGDEKKDGSSSSDDSSDEDDDKKPNESFPPPPSPEVTKVYLDGKLVQEIPTTNLSEKATEL